MRRALLLGLAVWLTLVCESSQAAQGGLGGISPGESLVPGTTRVIEWSVAPALGEGAEQELLLSLDGGATFSLRVTPERSTAHRETTFRVPNLPTPHACLGLRIGSAGHPEVLVAWSAEFSITADPVSSGETFRTVRGELATLEAMGTSLPPLSLPGFLSTIPDRIEEGDAEAEIADDEEPGSAGLAGSSSHLAADSDGSASSSSASIPAPRPRSFPFRPMRE